MRFTDSRMLDVSWKLSAQFTPPGGYRLEYECQRLDRGTVYLHKMIKLDSLQQSCQVGPIRSNTVYHFNLFAIYNEASLDPGLEFSIQG